MAHTSKFDTSPYPTDGLAESRGGDHRPIQDNGTQGKTTYTSGDPSGNSDFPASPKPGAGRQTGNDQSIAQYGLKEGEVSHNGSPQDYGLSGD